MIIDNTKQEFSDLSDGLNGEILLESNKNGIIACSQEIAYMFAVATQEQRIFNGHDKYDYSLLDTVSCRKPTYIYIENIIRPQVLDIIASKSLPAQAKSTLESRINNLLNDMQTTPNLDDAIRIALQLCLDAEDA